MRTRNLFSTAVNRRYLSSAIGVLILGLLILIACAGNEPQTGDNGAAPTLDTPTAWPVGPGPADEIMPPDESGTAPPRTTPISAAAPADCADCRTHQPPQNVPGESPRQATGAAAGDPDAATTAVAPTFNSSAGSSAATGATDASASAPGTTAEPSNTSDSGTSTANSDGESAEDNRDDGGDTTPGTATDIDPSVAGGDSTCLGGNCTLLPGGFRHPPDPCRFGVCGTGVGGGPRGPIPVPEPCQSGACPPGPGHEAILDPPILGGCLGGGCESGLAIDLIAPVIEDRSIVPALPEAGQLQAPVLDNNTGLLKPDLALPQEAIDSLVIDGVADDLDLMIDEVPVVPMGQ